MKIILQSDQDIMRQARAAELFIQHGMIANCGFLIGDRFYGVIRRKTCISVYPQVSSDEDIRPEKSDTAEDPASRRPHATRVGPL
jgi:hypothetical protein